MKVCAFWSKTPVLLCLWCLPLSFLCHYNIINIAQQKAVHFGDLALFSKCGIWYNKSVRACEASGICADAARAHKRVDTYGFHPLVNHPFPLDSLAQIAYM